MRDIKFRAWDKKFNVMLDGVAVHDNENIVVVDVQVNEKYSEDIIDQRLETVEDAGPEHYCITGDIIIMQYTGLKDKNGVEIYEGDKLMHNKNVYHVKFSKNQFCLLLKEAGSETNWRSLEWCNNVAKYIEIIGNIYQNPSLINALNQQGETNNG